jgi:mannitol-specific phosphotransferase system IIBC component
MYSIVNIQTKEECDTLINLADAENKKLEFRKQVQENKHETYTIITTSIDNDLKAVNDEISVVESIAGALEMGATRSQLLNKLVNLQFKKHNIEQRKIKYKAITAVLQQFGINCTKNLISEHSSYISKLYERRSVL